MRSENIGAMSHDDEKRVAEIRKLDGDMDGPWCWDQGSGLRQALRDLLQIVGHETKRADEAEVLASKRLDEVLYRAKWQTERDEARAALATARAMAIEECVETVEYVRSRHGGNKRAFAASLDAIRALRQKPGP